MLFEVKVSFHKGGGVFGGGGGGGRFMHVIAIGCSAIGYILFRENSFIENWDLQ